MGQSLTMDDINVRFASMENRISDLESELKTLKSKDQDLETKIELKEVQADVSFILMEQVKLNDRNGLLGPKSARIISMIFGTLIFQS